MVEGEPQWPHRGAGLRATVLSSWLGRRVVVLDGRLAGGWQSLWPSGLMADTLGLGKDFGLLESRKGKGLPVRVQPFILGDLVLRIRYAAIALLYLLLISEY